jgi:hypothetical protein
MTTIAAMDAAAAAEDAEVEEMVFDFSAATADVVREAIRLLYDPHTDRRTRKQADRYLQLLKRHVMGWGIFTELLAEDPTANSDSNKRVWFATLGLVDKIRYFFEDLTEDVITSLRSSMLSHMLRLSEQATALSAAQAAGGGAAPSAGTAPTSAGPLAKAAVGSSAKSASNVFRILEKLAYGFADLVVQTQESAGSMLATMGGLFPADSHPLALLDILMALPESTNHRRTRITDRRRAELREGLRAGDTIVLPLIMQLLTQAGETNNAVLARTCFECLASWVYVLHLDATALAATPILSFLLSAMGAMPSLFDTAVDTLLDLVRTYAE